MAAPRRVLLVDASPYIFRAHFALPRSLVDRAGRPANAVYGFATFLLKLISDERPGYLGVAFDHSLTTSFRNELYAAYKRHREPPPAELEAQLDDCRRLTEALGVAAFVDQRYEADDILATLCQRVAPAAVTLVTSDKDLAQLVDQRVEWFDYARNERLGAVEVKAKLGVEPGQVADLLGLAGDPVDNIPGIRGVGVVSARRLLEHFASLEAMLERPHEVAELAIRGAARLASLLSEQADEARLSKRLAKVVSDVPLAATLEDLRPRPPQPDLVTALCARLGFDGLRQRLLERA
jgi:5'-3' exonuclease